MSNPLPHILRIPDDDERPTAVVGSDVEAQLLRARALQQSSAEPQVAPPVEIAAQPSTHAQGSVAGLSADAALARAAQTQNIQDHLGPERTHVEATPHHELLPHADNGLDFIHAERPDHEYARAQRHSRNVRFLKIALPLVAVLIIGAILGALILQALFAPEISVNKITLEDGNIVMERPKLNGFDKRNRPFKLDADQAMQDPANPTRVTLDNIVATLPMDENVSAVVEAGGGVYDAELKTLQLSKQIYVETDSGLKLNLEDADIDLDSGTLKTSGSVKASSPDANILADSLSVFENGNRIVFTGNVRMTIIPKNGAKADKIQ